MTIREAKRHIAAKLLPAVGKEEADAMASAILEKVKGYTPVQLAMYGDRSLLDATVGKIDRIVTDIVDGMPMQYALGSAWFHGREFAVNSSVLIPRPETSQLIDIVTYALSGRTDLHILDIGTGSGCIAISLALDLPFARVDAIDISPEALAVARENAASLKANVDFFLADALCLANPEPASETGHRARRVSDEESWQQRMATRMYDCIVSNPPYVLESERADMDARVYDHEPSLALFVPDADPLKFYRPIADYARTHLHAGGMLFFEINPLCADMLMDLLKSDFDAVALRDYKGNYRFIKAVRL